MRRLIVLAALAATVLVSGCSNVRKVTIETEPIGSEVLVDDDVVGQSPITYPFDFDKKKSFKIYAKKVGYVENFVTLSEAYLEAKADEEKPKIQINLERDEAYHATTQAEAGVNNWLEVEINPRLGKDDVWQRLVAIVTKCYPNIDQLDPESGYMVSKEKTETFKRGLDTLRIQTKFVSSILSRKPLVYKIKVESQQSTGGRWTPYGRVFKEDAQLLQEIQSQLTAQ